MIESVYIRANKSIVNVGSEINGERTARLLAAARKLSGETAREQQHQHLEQTTTRLSLPVFCIYPYSTSSLAYSDISLLLVSTDLIQRPLLLRLAWRPQLAIRELGRILALQASSWGAPSVKLALTDPFRGGY